MHRRRIKPCLKVVGTLTSVTFPMRLLTKQGYEEDFIMHGCTVEPFQTRFTTHCMFFLPLTWNNHELISVGTVKDTENPSLKLIHSRLLIAFISRQEKLAVRQTRRRGSYSWRVILHACHILSQNQTHEVTAIAFVSTGSEIHFLNPTLIRIS